MIVDTPNYNHDELLAKCDIHLAYLGNGLFTELRPIMHSVPVPPASEIDPETVTTDVLNKSSGTTLVYFNGNITCPRLKHYYD